jgi:hypothetical protein
LKLVATSVVRGSHPGESHGGAYLVDLEAREVRQALDWNTQNIDWQGHGRDRGLRGIAFDGDIVYIAASDELFAYTPEFRRVGAWRNPYLKHCHEIAIWERHQFRFAGRAFDPGKDNGPLMLNKLHLNSLHCTWGGMYLTGLRTGGMLLFNGREVRMAVELPAGSRNARPFRDGVLFNDTEAGVLRYAGRGSGSEDRAMRVPTYPAESLLNRELDQSGVARQGFARGLAVLSDSLVAGGSSPSTISVYELAKNERVLSVNLTMDVRNAIHGLEVWPY